MKRKTLLLGAGTLLFLICLTLWMRQPLPKIALLGRIDFSKSKNVSDGLLASSEDGTLGGSRGDLIGCSIQKECFALGVLNGKETVFIAKSGRVTPIVLPKNKNESFSTAFAISPTGKYWWTFHRGIVRRKKNTKSLEIAPNTAKITAYRRDGKIQQQWPVSGSSVSRVEALKDDSLIVLGSSNKLYRYQIGQFKPKLYPHGEFVNPSAAIGLDGFIWSPAGRSAEGAISLLGISIFSPETSAPLKITFSARRTWEHPIQGNRNQGLFVGDGGTLSHMRVSLLRPGGQYEDILKIRSSFIVGFTPPREARYIWKYLSAGRNYTIVETKLKDQSGKGVEYFILKITSVPRWKAWFS